MLESAPCWAHYKRSVRFITVAHNKFLNYHNSLVDIYMKSKTIVQTGKNKLSKSVEANRDERTVCATCFNPFRIVDFGTSNYIQLFVWYYYYSLFESFNWIEGVRRHTTCNDQLVVSAGTAYRLSLSFQIILICWVIIKEFRWLTGTSWATH